jgi:ribosomal protein L37AE/L43A
LTIPEHARRTEAELWAKFNLIAGKVLGGLLDATAQAIKTFREVELESLPRMADFAIWLAAAETSLGWTPGAFDQAYRRNRLGADEAAIESSLIATRVRGFFEDFEGDWVGTASQLLEALNRGFDPDERRNRERSKDWPTRPHILSGKLRRLAPNLRRLGIEVVSGTNWERKLIIRRLPQSSVGSAGSAGSAPDSNASHAPNAVLHTQSKSSACPDCGGPLVETPAPDGWLNADCRICGKTYPPRNPKEQAIAR